MRFYLLLLFSLLQFTLAAQLKGVVFEEHQHSLPSANLLLLPDSLQMVADLNGRFSFDNLSSGSYELQTSYLGYKTDTTYIDFSTEDPQQIKLILFHDHNLLQTVIVHEEHAKQELTLQTDHVHEDFFQKNFEGTFAQTIEKLPGISSINVGVGIAKPVIRGLSANRIIVNHQGIKQESQQWGSDHGLEIDQFDVERVEIIKGPGSLQYGSDGLGGVINIMPAKILPVDSYKGSVMGLYKSNNDHWGGSAKLGFNVKNWFLSARYSQQDFADYQVPSEIFVYNDFSLPILNNRLKNTAGNEANLSLSTGINKEWGITRLHFSHYSLDAGLFSGAVGVPRSYALTHDGNYRDIDVPQQQVDHYRLSFNQILYLGGNHLAFDIGLQRNLRQEFSQPEFHSIPLSQLEDPNDKLAIELLLETFSVAAHYEHRFPSEWKNIFGLNAQWQRNERAGFEYLLPDFKTFRGGLYSIFEKEVTEDWLINGGLRFDMGHNNTDFFRQQVWDSNENVIDSLISVATDDYFLNWSASLGTNLAFADSRWRLKANIGKSFRVPYPAETVSNGIHHGTFRHEVGTPELKSEQGYQLDIGVYYESEKMHGSLSYYFNYFDNYIYLGPTFPARFSNLPEAGQIFQYRQDDAIYTGFELQWDWDFLPKLELSQAADYVQSYNPQTGLALPFTPQPSVRTDLIYSPFENNMVTDFYLELAHEYHFAAEGRLRIDRSETATPAYQLWDFGMGLDFEFGEQSFYLKFRVENLMNSRYLAHLSRYRVINVPEQGRNFILSLKVPFGGRIKKKA